jgi:16S rRNA (guanine966-N2)-methyltransferase
MRIVGGAFRGRRIVAPEGQSTRPTADRARESLFNVLGHASWASALEGARVVDLFAGSGALGLEALSHGAAFCLFVERSAQARAAIEANIAALGLEARTRIDGRDATALTPRRPIDGPAFDRAFLDPPYGQGAAETALARLADGDWLAVGAIAVLERGVGDAATTPPGFDLLDSRVWGAAKVSFLRRTQFVSPQSRSGTHAGRRRRAER